MSNATVSDRTERARRELEEVETAVREFQRSRLYGSVLLRFQDGALQLVERTEQRKIKV